MRRVQTRMDGPAGQSLSAESHKWLEQASTKLDGQMNELLTQLDKRIEEGSRKEEAGNTPISESKHPDEESSGPAAKSEIEPKRASRLSGWRDEFREIREKVMHRQKEGEQPVSSENMPEQATRKWKKAVLGATALAAEWMVFGTATYIADAKIVDPLLHLKPESSASQPWLERPERIGPEHPVSKDVPIWRATATGVQFDAAAHVTADRLKDGSYKVEVVSPYPLHLSEQPTNARLVEDTQRSSGRFVARIHIPAEAKNMRIYAETETPDLSLSVQPVGQNPLGRLQSDPILIFDRGQIEPE